MGNRGVKDEKISWKHITAAGGIGILLFYGNGWLLGMNVATTLRAALYTATLLVGFLGMLAAGLWSSRLLKNRMTDDPFNAENESFMQETRLLKNDDSFNFPTEFVFRRRRHSGWINVVNPFRASIVLGTPGSGKSYALINNYIKQAIEKGYALYVYDFKFDDLSVIAYNHLRKNLKAYGATPPRFYVINFDDPRRSHRCNPLAPNLMSDITDAYEASYVIMLNLNRSWIQKQGDFFVESPIVLLAAIIWFLKIYDGGKYCTFPHAIELLNKPYEDLFTVLMAYNHLRKNLKAYGATPPRFYVINFDDPRRSHRCNPLAPNLMSDITDAYEASYVIMLNLNRSWIQKQGDFFVESPIVLLAAIIWFLKIYDGGKYCTFPHAIELLNKPYEDLFTVLMAHEELENYLSPFVDAWKGGAAEQLMGQIASAKIPLSRMISPQLYWVMSGDDFTLDINNPEEPKILCVGNNPDRQNIYGAALGLYNSRIVKLINRKKQLKSCVVIDELPTIYFRGLDNLIATARSNKVAVCLGFQDFSQLKRDYGDKEAAVIQNTVGNIFSGQVVGETARTLSERFGKIVQKRQSVSINRSDTSTSINTQLDSLIPASKISTLSQSVFVGAVSDNFGEEIEQKIFHARIVVDNEAVKKEMAEYKPIPEISSFLDTDGRDIMQEKIKENYRRIKQDALDIIEAEMKRIEKDEKLAEKLLEKSE